MAASTLSTSLDQIREDDRFFAAQLDLIPRALLVPKSEEQREAMYERQQQRKQEKASKKSKKPSQNDDEQGKNKRKRTFEVKSNEMALLEATKESEKQEELLSKQLFANAPSDGKQSKPNSSSDASLAELRARLQSKIESERKKGGVPGARAQRDLLLPPKPPRPSKASKHEQTDEEENGKEDDKESESDNEENTAETPSAKPKPSKKEEIEAKISFGILKLDDGKKKIGDKPARSATSTQSIINVKKLIKQAEQGQKRVEALKAQGKDEIVEKEKWEILEKKAAGEKVRDDPKLLKKALKRLEKKKVKASKDWQERKTEEQKEKEDRLNQKSKNVQERKSKKIEKRGGVVQQPKEETAKKVRRRPGFEGSNAAFNKSKKPLDDHNSKQAQGKSGNPGKRPHPNAGGKSPFAGNKKLKPA